MLHNAHSTRVENAQSFSQRDVAVFFLGVGVALGFQGAEGGDNSGAGGGGLDYGVDVAALGGYEGVGETVAKFFDFFTAHRFALGFRNFFQLTLVDDVDGAFGAHDRDFRGGPREIGVGADVLGSHDAIGATVGFAGDDSDFGDGGFGEGEEQLGAVLDDAAEFLLRAGEEAGDVLEGDERDVESVAEAHEARAFYGGVDVEHAGKKGGLIGDDADRAAIQSRKTHDDIFGEMFVNFEEVRIVHDGVDGVFDVVGLLRIVGDERIKRSVAGHRNKIGDGGRIDGTAGAGAHDGADLRDHAAGESVAQKNIGVASEGSDTFLDARATGIVETDYGSASAHGLIHNLANLQRVGFGERTTEDGEVLRENINEPAVDAAEAGDETVAGGTLVVHAEVGAAVTHELVEFFERIFIEEEINALARG